MSLNPGDIAFVQYNADGIDNFAFVTLVNIPGSEVIRFTDNGWRGDNSGFRPGEGTIIWTAPASGVPAGTVITISTAPSTSLGTVVELGNLDFSSAGDQVIAYQGVTTPVPIAALNNDGGRFQADATSEFVSALPQGLIVGTSAFSPTETDNVVYTGPTRGEVPFLKAALNNPANWTGSDTLNQTFSGTFVIQTAGVTLTESAGSTATAEGGATDSYTVVLKTQPTANVTITLDAGGQLSVPSPLVFTPANWNVAQTVSVAAIDDEVAEGPHTGTIRHTVSSADANYNGLNLAAIAVAIADNDTAGITLTETDGTTAVTEAGATDTYSLVLTSQPTSNVAIAFVSNGQLLDIPPITFTPSNWNIAQTVTVAALDDVLVEGLHTGTVSHIVTSADANYNGLTLGNVTVGITDNDTAEIILTETDGTTTVSEAGATDTYSLVLTSQPTSNVAISFGTDGQLLGLPPVTFTPDNWNVAQTVTVSAVDDAVVEGPHSSTITHTVSSADANFNGLPLGNVTVGITDNDSAGIILTETDGTTTVGEAGTTDTYSLVLAAQPTSEVTVTFGTDGQLLGLPPVTFTPDNWNVAQTVTVAAVDDAAAEGPHTSTITHTVSSADANFNGLALGNVTVGITDNDTAGIILTETDGTTTVSEAGATDTYSLVLTSQPTSNVAISFGTDGQLLGLPPVTFTPDNWNVAQTLTVAAVDDAVAEGPHTGTITHTVSSADANFNGLELGNVNVGITDNDSAGIILTETDGTTAVSEAGTTDTYSLVLAAQPTSEVTVTFGTDGQLLGLPPVTFTPDNWNVAQTVTVAAVDDAIAEGPHTGTITHTVSSADANFNGLALGNVTVGITDNDTAGIILTETDGTTAVSEAGRTDTYSLVLAAQPTSDVTIAFGTDGQLLGLPPVTFTPDNWNVAQTVTVSAVDDAVAEGPHTGTITHTVSSADANFNGLALGNVTVGITDNDSAGIILTETDGTTAVSETGTTDTYSLVLAAQPTSEVTITFGTDGQLLGLPPVTFTPDNWNIAQTVTVSAVDDAIAEGPHTGNITHTVSSADANFNGLALGNVTVGITDNDTAGIILAETDGTTTVGEAGATDTYSLVLAAQPTSEVTVTFGTDGQLLGLPPVTFTPDNWNVAQTVTVSAVDDAVVEGPHSSTITHTVSSADANYNGLALGNVTVAIADNDTVPSKPVPEVFDLTGFDGDVITTVTVGREAGYDNILKFYQTDADGRVGGLLPGEAGYEDAVRANLLDISLFTRNRTTTGDVITLTGGGYYAPALLIDGDINDLATLDDAITGMARIQREGNIWRFEDWTDGDFNDLVLTITSVEAAV